MVSKRTSRARRSDVRTGNSAAAMTTRERVYLAASLDPSQILRCAGITPDPWQVAFLTSTAQKILLCASRQSGKSTSSACLAAWNLAFRPGSLSVIVSPSFRQSQETFRKVVQLHEALGAPVSVSGQTSGSITLRDGSRVICTPGTERSVRGLTPDLLLVDEASRLPDETFSALSPALAASKGRWIAISTPNGKSGWFSSLWHAQDPSWLRVSVAAPEIARFDAAYLEGEKRVLGERVFAQEFLAQFSDNEDNQVRLVTPAQVSALFSDAVRPLF